MGSFNMCLRWLLRFLLLAYLASAQAAFVEFVNCLDEVVINSEPRVLQFVPLNVSAAFYNSENASHLLNVTVYGNVTGQLYNGTYPAPDDPSWSNPNDTTGKIVDVEPDAKLATTLFGSFNVLSYTPYNAAPARFCENVVNEACPIGPVFYRNSSNIQDLPGYTIGHDLASSYAFSTISATTRIQAGSENSQFYGCVTAYITPDLGDTLRGLLRYLPLGILVIVGVATVAAAMLSPWGSLNIFHWSSNFGRDEDILRLVTPGFGDCLQYIQFVVFTGSLSLNYPGYYQPVVSRLAWSTLIFNESLVTGGEGATTLSDGIYQYRPNTKQGLDRITQLVGMTSPSDAWADMMVWLVVIIACVIVLTQIGFLLQWIYRQVKHVEPEDLRSKNWYFSVGNVVRIALGYFLLPLIALSMYQFVISSLGPSYAVALAAVVIAFIFAFTAWMTFQFIRIRPRSFFFDDLQTVLLYGPLYNTYRDDKATFALIPILINLLRGIAIGAVQGSGVAQIVLLAICEIVLILSVNAIRPYPGATSMNLYHTCFSVIRLLTILLTITFIPSLGVATSSRGWIGYVILLIHACVLVFGFFLNAIQTLIEVIARLAGAGTDGGRDAARGGLTKVFGVRQLARRSPRADNRNSMGSNAQMLTMLDDNKEMSMTRTRTRTISASSGLLMDGKKRKGGSQTMEGSSNGRQTPDGMSTFSRLSKNLTSPGAIVGLSKQDSKDPYYRPPRRNTNDFNTTSGKPAFSGLGQKDVKVAEEAIDDGGEGSSGSQNRPEEDENGIELTKSKTDYAVREVDFYYGVRGPALSSGTRKLKTGPADPTASSFSAKGWFKNLLGGKTKEQGKGFEVVRSARAPPPGAFTSTPEPEQVMPQTPQEPYTDEPENSPMRSQTVDRTVSTLSRDMSRDGDAVSFSTAGESYASPIPRTSPDPPNLPAIDSVGGIELPSRIGSEASRKKPRPVDRDIPAVPPIPGIPRRSSRRTSDPRRTSGIQEPPIAAAPPESPARNNRDLYATSPQHRLPFSRGTSNRTQNRNSTAHSEVSSYMDEPVVETENLPPQMEERPGSVGFVKNHRASDNIRYSPDEAQIPRLSTVEYGYQPSHIQTQGYPQAQPQTSAGPETPFSPAWNGSAAYSANADGTQRFSRFRD